MSIAHLLPFISISFRTSVSLFFEYRLNVHLHRYIVAINRKPTLQTLLTSIRRDNFWYLTLFSHWSQTFSHDIHAYYVSELHQQARYYKKKLESLGKREGDLTASVAEMHNFQNPQVRTGLNLVWQLKCSSFDHVPLSSFLVVSHWQVFPWILLWLSHLTDPLRTWNSISTLDYALPVPHILVQHIPLTAPYSFNCDFLVTSVYPWYIYFLPLYYVIIMSISRNCYAFICPLLFM